VYTNKRRPEKRDTIRVGELNRDQLLYPLKYNEIRENLYGAVRKYAQEKGYRIRDIHLNNLIKIVLSKAKKNVPTTTIEDLKEALLRTLERSSEVLRCMGLVKMDARCKELRNSFVNTVITEIIAPQRLADEDYEAVKLLSKIFFMLLVQKIDLAILMKVCKVMKCSEDRKLCLRAIEEAKEVLSR